MIMPGTTLTTPVGRVCFAHVYEKTKANENAREVWSLDLVFPPGTDLTSLKQAAHAAAKAKWGDKVPPNLRSPFRSCDDRAGTAGYGDGETFISFRQDKIQPAVVDQNLNSITPESGRFYSGCFARVSTSAYAYSKAGNVGVSFSLHNVQKTEDGENLAFGARRPEDDFEVVEGFGAPAETDVTDLF